MLPFPNPWDVVGLRTTASVWNVPKKYGPHGVLFFLVKKEPVVVREVVDFGPCLSHNGFSLELGEIVELWLSKKLLVDRKRVYISQ